jgi:hypothetical protein
MPIIKKQLVIVLDESAENQSNRIGPSLCFWAAYVYVPSEDTHPTNSKIPEESRYEAAILMKSANLKPIRSGAIYNDSDTQIKICLDGMLRAFEACKYIVSKYKINEVIICGDCGPAIDLASGVQNRVALAVIAICGQIDDLKTKYGNNGAAVIFKKVSETHFTLYRDIDSIAKQVRGLMKKISQD